jgi:hypothetical protein
LVIPSFIHTAPSKRIINHVQNLYQKELDKIVNYMYQNGMELSGEKTYLMFFNNGQKPVNLPKLEINGIQLNYESKVKFLGVYFTPKLNWKVHIEYLITKARKRLIFFKISKCTTVESGFENTDSLSSITYSIKIELWSRSLFFSR